MSHPLPGMLAGVAPLLDHYGYAAVGTFAFVEGFGVPVPAVTVLIAAAVYAGSGHLSLLGVVALALLGSIAGDNLGYGLGRWLGRRAVVRWGRFVGLTEARVARAERFLCHGGGNIVVVARFIDGLRQTNGLIAGTIGMPWQRYLVRDAIGGTLWVAVWVGLGYFTGDHVDKVYATVMRYQMYVIVAVALVLVGAVAWHVVGRRRRAARERTTVH
jgi:membrane protein DedA with SNARE-associated domain